MPRATTGSFVTEVELLPTGKQAKKLRSKFEAARQVYNACLGECLKRVTRMRESKDYQKARKIGKGPDKNAAFREVAKVHRFREYDLGTWSTQFTKSWINEHIGAKTVAQIASTAFQTVCKYSFGKRRRPRFRRKGEMRAIDGRTGSCCRWKEDRIVWKGLIVKAKVDAEDSVLTHGLAARIKFTRIVQRVIRGHQRFFAQLVCEGKPFRKESHRPTQGIVGIDLGPQTIAYVGQQQASLEVFCHELVRDERAIRRLLRAMDRSRRANNVENFNTDGTIKRTIGQRLNWRDSKNYLCLRQRRAEMSRQEAAYRKNLHGSLVARVLSQGDDVRLEKLNYAGWQRRRKTKRGSKKGFGKSLGKRGPGMFVARLKSEAAKWDARVTEFATRTTKLSRTCHCGNVQVKALSDRWHCCEQCGAVAQRDLYSAFLARFVEDGELKADQARAAWPSDCAALEAALSRFKDAMEGLPSSLGLRSRGGAPCLQNDGQKLGEIADVVAGHNTSGESRKEPSENHQTPSFFQRSLHLTQGSDDTCGDPGADTG